MRNANKKIISLMVCSIFAYTTAVSAISPVDIEVRPLRETPSYLQVQIPDDLASIDEVYEAPAKLDPRLVLHIQDAHGNYEAQMKIKKLLDYLYKTYKFDLLFVEGASEELDGNNLKLFNEQEKNLKMADQMAQKGQLTGSEYFMMDSPGNVKAVGIEEPKLYRENYRAFRNVYRHKPEVDNFLNDMDSRLEILSSRFFTADTRRLLSEWKKFHQGHRDFLPYIKQLAIEANRILGLDLESLFAQVEWPQITRLLVLQAMEKDINRTQALKERGQLLEFLKKTDVSEPIRQGVERLEEKRISINRLLPDGASLEDLPRHLLEKLVEEAGPKGFRFQDYPAFSLYAGYLIIQSEVQSPALFEEIERVFKKILDELTVTEGERDLMEIFRDSELLKKLLFLELTREEWARAFYRREWIKPEVVSKRIQTVSERMEESGKYQFAPQNAMHLMELSKNIADIFQTAFRFYDLARQRESVFYYRIKQEMTARKAEKAILVTGGFHTDGLMKLFQEDEVSYGILTPRLSQTEGHDNYVNTMMETHSSLFDISQLQVVLASLTPDVIKAQGGSLKRTILQRILPAFQSAGGYRTTGEAANAFNQTGYSQRWGIRIVAGRDGKNREVFKVLRRKQQPSRGGRSEARDLLPPFGGTGATPAEPSAPITSVVPVPQAVLDLMTRYPGLRNGRVPLSQINGLPASQQVTLLTSGIIGNEVTKEVALEAAAIQLSSSNLPPYLKVFQHAMTAFPSLLTPSDDVGLATIPMTRLPSANELKNLGRFLSLKGNQYVQFLVVSDTLTQIQADRRMARIRQVLEDERLPADEIAKRIMVKVVGKKYAQRDFLRLSRAPVSQIYNALKSDSSRPKDLPVPSPQEIIQNHTALLMTPEAQKLLGEAVLDDYQGAIVSSEIEFERKGAGRELNLAQWIANLLLSQYRASPDKLAEMTAAALKNEYPDQGASSKQWQISPNELRSFARDVVRKALLALEADLRTAAAA